MKKKTIVIISAVVLAIVLIFILYKAVFRTGKDYKESLEYAEVEKGDIKITVSCTGTINAQKTVEVGTQVSGTIAKIYADFNNRVKKNQILALLDTKLLEISVKSAEANLLKANAQYEHAVKEYDNNVILDKSNLISKFDLDTSRVAKESAYADKLSAEANLDRAKQDFNNAVIRSPIDGTVIERNVEEGQTVAASLSAPTLFTIAEDLSNIQIDALVSESDIGSIRPGLKAVFTVEAFPDETFTGTVREIHLKPTIDSNVVNYTVIVYAKNTKNLLLPGMTATIDFIIEEKNDVNLISNSALKFKPTDAMLKDLRKSRNNKNAENSETRKNIQANRTNRNFSKENNQSKENIGRLWYLNKERNPEFIVVKTGLNDGQKTEIINDTIQPGLKFISGISTDKNKQNKETHFPRRFF